MEGYDVAVVNDFDRYAVRDGRLWGWVLQGGEVMVPCVWAITWSYDPLDGTAQARGLRSPWGASAKRGWDGNAWLDLSGLAIEKDGR